jgi:hypothetical protein
MRKGDQQRKRLTKREQRQREPLPDFNMDGKAGYYPAYHAVTNYMWLMSGNAWKIVCYVLRHTIGYQKEYAPKRITLDEFEHGRKRRDGSRIDHGIGMYKQQIEAAIVDAVRAGALYVEEDERDKGRITWYYAVIAPDNPASGVYVNQRGEREIKLVGGVYHPPEHVNLYAIHTALSTSERELMYEIHPAISSVRADLGYEIHPAEDENPTSGISTSSSSSLKVIQRSEKETRERNGEKQFQKESVAAAPPSPSGSPVVFNEEGRENKEELPNLVALRTEYAILSQQLEQLDVHKQAGQWARLYKRVQAAEARLRHAEQEAPPSPDVLPECAKQQPEYAKQQAVQADRGETALPPAEMTEADERQSLLRAITSDLLYWKGGLKVLRQAQLPRWRGCFKWQIEARIVDLQTEYARLRAEVAEEGG